MVADAGCTVDAKFYAVLARGCLQLYQPAKAIEVIRAAYQLPGHSMALPTRTDRRPVGLEARDLYDIAGRLQACACPELAKLSADLLEQRGVRLSESQVAYGSGGNKGAGNKGAGNKGAGKGSSKGAGKGKGKW